MTCSATWLYKRWANPMDSPGSAVLNGGHHCHHPLRKTQVLTYPSLHHLQIQYVSKSKSQRLELNPVQLLHLCTSYMWFFSHAIPRHLQPGISAPLVALRWGERGPRAASATTPGGGPGGTARGLGGQGEGSASAVPTCLGYLTAVQLGSHILYICILYI